MVGLRLSLTTAMIGLAAFSPAQTERLINDNWKAVEGPAALSIDATKSEALFVGGAGEIAGTFKIKSVTSHGARILIDHSTFRVRFSRDASQITLQESGVGSPIIMTRVRDIYNTP